MDVLEVITKILLMLSGLGVFLIGLKMMGDNLESAAGSKLRKLFERISGNRFAGMTIGAGVTAVIQSSSATTVMVVGFVNAGVMTLTQAASIIMGANIGTTITAQILQLQALNVTVWLAALACVGAFMMMAKKPSVKKIGAILAGLGMIFVGLDVMGGAMKYFAGIEAFANFFKTTSNPFLLILMGLAFTALIQSSSATTGILITMSAAGVISLQSSIYVILGINIGTCVTALLACIGATTNAKRAAVIHLLFNVIGALIFFLIVYFTPLASAFESLFPDLPATQIAMFHTLFNVTTSLFLVCFVKQLVKLSELIIKDKKVKDANGQEQFTAGKMRFIDDRILNTPVIALSQLKKEILFMAELAMNNLSDAIESVTHADIARLEVFEEREQHLNFLNREITNFLVKVSSLQISFKDEIMIGSYFHVVSDLERIGDYAENIMDYTRSLIRHESTFSAAAVEDINNMYKNVNILYENMIRAFTNQDVSVLKIIAKYEDIVDESKRQLKYKHFERLKRDECTPETGALFLSLISNLERIADHMNNIAQSIKDYAKMPVQVAANIKSKNEVKVKSDKNK